MPQLEACMQNDGQQAALVRFDSPEKAAAALEAVGPEGKVSVDGNVGTAVLLQGADEEALYQRMVHPSRGAWGSSALWCPDQGLHRMVWLCLASIGKPVPMAALTDGILLLAVKTSFEFH